MELIPKSKKGVVDQLFPLVIALVAVGIIITVGFLILSEAKTQVMDIQGLNSSGQLSTGVHGTTAYNSTGEIQNAMDTLPTWLPIIVITIIGALLIGLVSMFRR